MQRAQRLQQAMYRAASRLPRRALLATSVAGAVTLQTKEKLSIYPSPDTEILLVETPSALEQHIGVARKQVCQTYRDGREYVQGWVSKWIGIEHAIENRVKSIISPHESLTPGLLYVGVATLTGSILARNRILLARLALPPVFLAVSAKHFLPKTTNNLTDYLGSIEDTYAPGFADKHEIAKAHTAMTWSRIKEATKDSRAKINHGAILAVEKAQEATGLKLRETLGWGEHAKEKVVSEAIEIKEAVQSVLENAKTTADEKVEDMKAKDVKVEDVKVEVEEEVKEEEKKLI